MPTALFAPLGSAVDGVSTTGTDLAKIRFMSPGVPIPPELRRRLFRGCDAVSAGLVTERQLRTARFQRVLRGVYADSRMRIDHGIRCEAALMVLPPGVALTAHSAAWMFGVKLAARSDPVVVTCPPGAHIKGVQGVTTHRTVVDESDLIHRRGMLLTTPVRLAWDVAALADFNRAVTFLDALANAGVLDLRKLEDRVSERSGMWRVRRVRDAVQHADARSESPPESELRLLIVKSGLPHPEVQFEIHDDGSFVARVDLAWPHLRVAVEYDGAHHADALQMRRDRRRLNALVNAGWTVIHATAQDMREPDVLLAQIRAALARNAA